MRKLIGGASALAVCCLGFVASSSAQTLSAPSYTAQQAAHGQAVYIDQCQGCHGDALDNGEYAAPLRGPVFTAHWGGKGLDAPFDFMTQQMPPTNPGGLDASTYADVLAFILSKNGVAPSATPLPSTADKLKVLAAPK